MIYVDGEIDGLSKSWYENGQLRSETNYKLGSNHSSYIMFHKNGQEMD